MLNEVTLPGVRNARELGGIRIGDRQIKSGRLLRSAYLTHIKPEAVATLCREYRLYYVVDFRMSTERESEPDPKIPGALNRFLSVMEMEDVPGFDAERSQNYMKSADDRMQMLLEAAETGFLDEGFYVFFLDSDRGKGAYREFFEMLLELPGDRGVLWHCSGGKDRTGVASMLLLSALGADRDTIMEEYLHTNRQNEGMLQKVKRELEGTDLSAKQREAVLFGSGGVNEKYMKTALTWLDEHYGGGEGYLETELAVDETARDRLKSKFLC